MKREEAISLLGWFKSKTNREDDLEAIDMAIKVLSEPSGGLISKAEAIEAVCGVVIDEFDVSPTLGYEVAEKALSALPSAEIAETEPIVIRSKTLLPTKDFKEWAKRIREVNPNAVVIPCDAEVASAEAVRGEWIEVEVLPEVYDIEGVKTWGSKMQCDQCGFRHTAIEGRMAQYNFCPNCGAKMKGGEQNDD